MSAVTHAAALAEARRVTPGFAALSPEDRIAVVAAAAERLQAVPDPAVVARNAWASGLAVAPALPSYEAALEFAEQVLLALPSVGLGVDIRLAHGSPVFPVADRVFAVFVSAVSDEPLESWVWVS